ncbi:hypothetical protein BH11PLA2_BH11PLA2_00750 [soil metagenome]
MDSVQMESKSTSEVPVVGLTAFACLAIVGSMGTDILPTQYYPDLIHYIPRYCVLAISVGCGISAIRSRNRMNRLLGYATTFVGLALTCRIVEFCLRINGYL